MISGSVTEADLDLGVHLGGGGQANVYEVRNRQATVFKKYHVTKVNAPALRRLLRVPEEMTAPEATRLRTLTSWPRAAVLASLSGSVTGFLMDRVPEPFTFSARGRSKLNELQFLIYPPRPAWSAAVAEVNDGKRVAVALELARLVEFLHVHEVVIGDISPRNVLWSVSPVPAVYLIDADGCRASGSHPVTPQLDTPGWQDPRRTAAAATLDSDRYKLALAVVRTLGGSHRLMLDDADGTWSLGDQRLRDLAARAAHSAARPDAAAWVCALSATTSADTAAAVMRPTIRMTGVRRPPKAPASRRTIPVRRPNALGE